jgi:ABC-type cobalamin/Fe3+-siderophores transport system ATPase subunit
VADVPVLRLDGVWLGFERGGWVSVLEDVSLEVWAGQVAAVVGGRSQGKSMLIRVAAGMLCANRGSVSIDGREVRGLSKHDLERLWGTEIGIATRDGEERLNVHDYLEMSLAAARKYSGRERARRVKDVLAELEISGCAGSKWDELSDWQRVLVEFAQAIVRCPKLLLVDDVVDGMGFDQKRAAMDLMEGFAKDRRCGVLMAVSDHAAALRSATVWQLSHTKLELMHQDPDITYLHQHRPPRARVAES